MISFLQAMGHDIRVARGVQRGMMGRGQIIQRLHGTSKLTWAAGSDPRADGHASPQI